MDPGAHFSNTLITLNSTGWFVCDSLLTKGSEGFDSTLSPSLPAKCPFSREAEAGKTPAGEGAPGQQEGLTHRFSAWRHTLTFISIKSSRTEGHTGIRLLLVIEPAAARQALGRAPAGAGLTPLVAPAAASCCCVPKVAQGAYTHALPGKAGERRPFQVSQAPCSRPAALPTRVRPVGCRGP